MQHNNLVLHTDPYCDECVYGSSEYLHSCLMSAILIGWKGCLAAWYTCSMSLHTCREMRVSGVVIRQNAARVFITGRGLPARIASPCAVARWRARCDLRRNSCVDELFLNPQLKNVVCVLKNLDMQVSQTSKLEFMWARTCTFAWFISLCQGPMPDGAVSQDNQ